MAFTSAEVCDINTNMCKIPITRTCLQLMFESREQLFHAHYCVIVVALSIMIQIAKNRSRDGRIPIQPNIE